MNNYKFSNFYYVENIIRVIPLTLLIFFIALNGYPNVHLGRNAFLLLSLGLIVLSSGIVASIKRKIGIQSIELTSDTELGRHYSHIGTDFTALRIGWTIPEDTPRYYDTPYMRAIFCSHRDLISIVQKALNTPEPYSVGFAISNNSTRVFDLEGTKEQLGFIPQDDSADY